jgi:hypothetical protein
MILTLTDVIAVYGAVVATIVAFHQIRDSRVRVRVEVQRLYAIGSRGPRMEMIEVRAISVGSRAVAFKSLPSLNDFVVPVPNLPSDSFPCSVAPGDSCSVSFDPKILADALKKDGARGSVDLVGRYRDATGQVFRSKQFAFDLGGTEGDTSASSGKNGGAASP